MRKRKVWVWLICGLLLLVFSSVAWPLIANAKRPKQLSIKINKVYSQVAKVKGALDMIGMTRQSVVSEGPCEGGCNGGILSQQVPTDMQNFIPNLQGYDGESTSIIWLYQVRPEEITRRNDLFGDDIVTITGTATKDHKVYFAVVPTHLVEPRIYWIYVNIKPN